MIYNEIHITTSEITSKLELFAYFLARCMLTWLDLLSVVLAGGDEYLCSHHYHRNGNSVRGVPAAK